MQSAHALRRETDRDGSPIPVGALGDHRAAGRLDATPEPDRARSTEVVGSADAVVADRGQEPRFTGGDVDLHVRGLRVLGRFGEGLADA